jgi:hypothetical protein
VGSSQKITIVAADDVDLSKVAIAYVKIASPEHEEFVVDKPAGGWPKTVERYTSIEGKLDITVTAYDAAFHLLALGKGREVSGGTEVLVQANIPWN